MNCYLDIDGVILANDYNPANHVHEFLEAVNNRAEAVYWLTTHCQGDASTAVKRLSSVLEPQTLELVKSYRPTAWKTAKTEAIDFSQPFVWFDDDLFSDEAVELNKHGLMDNWVEVNLSKNENQLLDFVSSFPLPVN